MPARLRPEILRRHFHLAAELGRRVPRPAGIVERATRQCDEVRISRADDGLGLLEPRDHADGNDGHVDGALHLAGKRHLVARPDGNLLPWVQSSARYMDRRAAALL